MIEFFKVDAATNEVYGWHRAGKINVVPDAPEGFMHVDATNRIPEYDAILKQMREDGRSDPPVMANGVLSIPADPRPRFRVNVSKSVIAADGVDTTVVTVEFVDQNDQIVTAYNDTRYPRILDGQVWRCVYVAGVATVNFTTTQSGEFILRSGPEFKIVNGPATVTAYR